MSTTWSARVKRGKSLVEREGKGVLAIRDVRFQLGDEILAVREEAEYGDASVEQYAADIGIHREKAYEYARIAKAFPIVTRGSQSREFNASYSVFRELAGREERFQVLAKLRRRKPEGRYWTVDEVRSELGLAKSKQTLAERIESASEAEKVEIATALVQTPEVARQLGDDHDVIAAFTDGMHEAAQDSWARQAEMTNQPNPRVIEGRIRRESLIQRKREEEFTFPEKMWSNLIGAASVIEIEWKPTKTNRVTRERGPEIVAQAKRVIELMEMVITEVEAKMDRLAATPH